MINTPHLQEGKGLIAPSQPHPPSTYHRRIPALRYALALLLASCSRSSPPQNTPPVPAAQERVTDVSASDTIIPVDGEKIDREPSTERGGSSSTTGRYRPIDSVRRGYRPFSETNRPSNNLSKIRDLDLTSQNISLPPKVLELLRGKFSDSKEGFSTVTIGMNEFSGGNEEDQSEMEKKFKILGSSTRLYFSMSDIPDPNIRGSTAYQFLRISYDLEGGIVQKIEEGTPSVSRLYFAQIPDIPFLQQLRESLHLGEVTTSDQATLDFLRQEAVNIKERQRAVELKVEELSWCPAIDARPLVETNANTSEIHIVNQGEFTVASAEDVRWVATFGANPCYIVGIHSSGERKGALTHMDAVTSAVQTLQMMRYQLGMKKRDDEKSYTVVFSCGDGTPREDIVNAYEIVLGWKEEGIPVDVRIAELSSKSASLAIDLETGMFSKFECLPGARSDLELKVMGLTVESRALGARFEPGGKIPASPSFPRKKEKE